MRPPILFPLFADIGTLPGLGPKLAALAAKLAGPHVVNLLWHLPNGLVDRRYRPTIGAAEPGRIATIAARVDAHVAPMLPGRPWRVRMTDATGVLELAFFSAKREWLAASLPIGETRIVSGRIELFNGQPQMAHPDAIIRPEELESLAVVEPVYPLTGGLPGKVLRRAIGAALDRAPALPEWQDSAWLAQQGLPDWRTALALAHAPDGAADLEPNTPARRRLAYDELLASQLAIALIRERARRQGGRAIKGDGRLLAKLRDILPWPLTGAQDRAIAEIRADMAEPRRMRRLLQGDVGSGKTVVALATMLLAVEDGYQAALMAPTELLARQHARSMGPLAEALGVPLTIVTGRDKGKAKAALLDEISSGRARLIIGTHALIQEDVTYPALGLAVIDEQHKFGVEQRTTLTSKGQAVDLLVMSATPIPRTLLMTAYGDLDASRLDEKPPGRQPIKTTIVAAERMDELLAGLKRQIAGGARIYWVCPLVEESELIDLAAAEARHAVLLERFGGRVGLAHGKMKPADRDRVMTEFKEGRLDMLVATTVIEVGVDVPEATVMVIEHAERFGLAQLHQLRGRVGRGSGASACVLLYDPPLSETARARLDILRATEDGFRIAEEDLRLRGAGEILGTRQSGVPEFRMVDLTVHGDLLAAARDDARLILERDPELGGARADALRTLLYLFERDAAAHALKGG